MCSIATSIIPAASKSSEAYIGIGRQRHTSTLSAAKHSRDVATGERYSDDFVVARVFGAWFRISSAAAT
jgi:hypothetical protein